MAEWERDSENGYERGRREERARWKDGNDADIPQPGPSSRSGVQSGSDHPLLGLDEEMEEDFGFLLPGARRRKEAANTDPAESQRAVAPTPASPWYKRNSTLLLFGLFALIAGWIYWHYCKKATKEAEKAAIEAKKVKDTHGTSSAPARVFNKTGQPLPRITSQEAAPAERLDGWSEVGATGVPETEGRSKKGDARVEGEEGGKRYETITGKGEGERDHGTRGLYSTQEFASVSNPEASGTEQKSIPHQSFIEDEKNKQDEEHGKSTHVEIKAASGVHAGTEHTLNPTAGEANDTFSSPSMSSRSAASAGGPSERYASPSASPPAYAHDYEYHRGYHDPLPRYGGHYPHPSHYSRPASPSYPPRSPYYAGRSPAPARSPGMTGMTGMTGGRGGGARAMPHEGDVLVSDIKDLLGRRLDDPPAADESTADYTKRLLAYIEALRYRAELVAKMHVDRSSDLFKLQSLVYQYHATLCRLENENQMLLEKVEASESASATVPPPSPSLPPQPGAKTPPVSSIPKPLRRVLPAESDTPEAHVVTSTKDSKSPSPLPASKSTSKPEEEKPSSGAGARSTPKSQKSARPASKERKSDKHKEKKKENERDKKKQKKKEKDKKEEEKQREDEEREDEEEEENKEEEEEEEEESEEEPERETEVEEDEQEEDDPEERTRETKEGKRQTKGVRKEEKKRTDGPKGRVTSSPEPLDDEQERKRTPRAVGHKWSYTEGGRNPNSDTEPEVEPDDISVESGKSQHKPTLLSSTVPSHERGPVARDAQHALPIRESKTRPAIPQPASPMSSRPSTPPAPLLKPGGRGEASLFSKAIDKTPKGPLPGPFYHSHSFTHAFPAHGMFDPMATQPKPAEGHKSPILHEEKGKEKGKEKEKEKEEKDHKEAQPASTPAEADGSEDALDLDSLGT